MFGILANFSAFGGFLVLVIWWFAFTFVCLIFGFDICYLD